jgi:RimJ/RimL family protein N-acetyltransferase
MVADTVAPLPMVSRHTRLRPPTPPFLDELYELAATDQIPWIWNTPGETLEAFRQSLWQGVIVQHAIEDLRSGRSVGLLIAYNANIMHRYSYFSIVLLPEYRLRVWPLEGALLFVNYVFRRFNLRNLYAETIGPHFSQFKSGVGKFFEVEGQYRDRVVINGATHDLYVLTITRDRWLHECIPLLEHCTP